MRFAFKTIYLRSNGPKFSDVQVTITEKMCDCGQNLPEITESLPGCYNGTRVKKQSGREFASVPAFSLKNHFMFKRHKGTKKPISNKNQIFIKKNR